MADRFTHRQRFQAVLDGRVPDKTPWVARLDLWYKGRQAQGTLPPEVKGKSLTEVEDFLGMGHSSRKAVVYRVEYEGLEERLARHGDYLTHTYVTPAGEASCTWYDPESARQAGVAKILTEHYIKSERDYEPMKYVAEHLRFAPDYDAYRKYDAEVGHGGYPLVIIGPSPIHSVMLSYFGYEQFYYWLADAPEQIEALLRSLEGGYRRMWEAVESRREAAAARRSFQLGDDAAAGLPQVLPAVLPRVQCAHARGRNQGRVSRRRRSDRLARTGPRCGFDVADTFACAPLVRCTFDEARAAWKNRIVIWGGVPSIILEPSYPLAEFPAIHAGASRENQGHVAFHHGGVGQHFAGRGIRTACLDTRSFAE